MSGANVIDCLSLVVEFAAWWETYAYPAEELAVIMFFRLPPTLPFGLGELDSTC